MNTIYTYIFKRNQPILFSSEKQIRVAQIEEMTKVPQKFRFPFFTELQWYALDKYVYALLGRTHLEFSDEEQCLLLGSEDERTQHLESLEQHHRHVTAQEIFGIKAIIMYIHALPVSKKNVPPLLKEPINLVRDIKLVVEGGIIIHSSISCLLKYFCMFFSPEIFFINFFSLQAIKMMIQINLSQDNLYSIGQG